MAYWGVAPFSAISKNNESLCKLVLLPYFNPHHTAMVVILIVVLLSKIYPHFSSFNIEFLHRLSSILTLLAPTLNFLSYEPLKLSCLFVNILVAMVARAKLFNGNQTSIDLCSTTQKYSACVIMMIDCRNTNVTVIYNLCLLRTAIV